MSVSFVALAAPLNVTAPDGRRLASGGDWRLDDDGAPVILLEDGAATDKFVGTVRCHTTACGNLWLFGTLDDRADVIAGIRSGKLRPQLELMPMSDETSTVFNEREGVRSVPVTTFTGGRIAALALGTNPAFSTVKIFVI